MSVKLTLQIGRTPVLIEAETLKECFEKTELLCQLPQCCGNCNSDNIFPGYSPSGGYEFYFLRCGDCKHELKFGMRKSDKALFPKFDEGKEGWVEPFKGGGGGGESRSYSRPADRPTARPTAYEGHLNGADDDEIPF